MPNSLVNGIPLVIVVLGLVEFTKKMGAASRLLTIISLLIGLGLGIAYQLSLAPLVTYAAWFGAVIYGLALGLVACGLYNLVDSRFPKVP